MTKLLVIGAAPESLGVAIAHEALNGPFHFSKVHTAGISGEEYSLDVHSAVRVRQVLNETQPDAVVCTVGINSPCGVSDEHMSEKFSASFEINVIGTMRVLQELVNISCRGDNRKFVAISSNSAHIARRYSLAYCASKAALSMALRVAARELASKRKVIAWGYEPGLLADTPMTKQVASDFGGEPLHRMPGIDLAGIPPLDLARRIITDISIATSAYSGLLIPFDADEQ